MARLTMISTKAHRYGNKLYKPGEFFTVPGRSDATLLEKLGRARLAAVIDHAPVRAVVEETVRTAVESAARHVPLDGIERRIEAVEQPAKRRGRPRKVNLEAYPAPAAEFADTEGGE